LADAIVAGTRNRVEMNGTDDGRYMAVSVDAKFFSSLPTDLKPGVAFFD